MTHSRNIYALLVGINDYAPGSGVPSLQGCVPDVEAFQEYLEDRVPSENLNLHTLFNEQATRQAVIDAFRAHLCQAKSADDTVVFYYAGHGSQEDAPEEFWQIEPDRLNETLVLYDSRTEQGMDLADKDLAVLIGEVAKHNPHIALILDSCHSGSGTRDVLQGVAERRVPKAPRKRPFDSYLVSQSHIADLKPANRSPESIPAGWSFPKGRHILLAACREYETAKEYAVAGGGRRGAFSRFLLDALTKANGCLSYRDLYQQANALVRSSVAAQSPQLEATVTDDFDLPFLGEGAIAARKPYFTVSHRHDLGWVINGGAVHGIAAPTGDETTRLALYPFVDTALSADSDSKEPPKPLGEAEITAVRPQLSQIQSETLDNLDPQTTLKAVVTSQPLPPLGVVLTAATPEDDVGIKLVRKALNTAGDNQTPSLYVAEANSTDGVHFRLLAQGGEYLVTRPADTRPLITQLKGYTLENAYKVVQNLEHIARWQKVVELKSPSSSQIPPEALKIEILQGNDSKETATTPSNPQNRLEYRYEPTSDTWKQPKIWISLTNHSQDSTLFCALFDLTEQFEIDAAVLPGGTVRLSPGETVWVNDGKPIYGSVPAPLWKQGITETRDILKVIACTTDFDASMMGQGELGRPLPPPTRSASRGAGTLNRLMKRVITRKLSSQPEDDEVYDDWIATEVTFTIVRPQAAAAVSRDAPVLLGMGVTLQPHSTLNAKVKLTNLNQSTRDLGDHMIPPILQTDPTLVQPFQFSSSRGDDPGLSVLELQDLDDESFKTVTPENPLTLTLAGESLDENEQILALAYDGEFYIPLGAGQSMGEQFDVTLERLPEPVSEGERSLQGSIRIFFQKIISKRLQLEFPYPLLSAVNVHPDGTVDPYDSIEVSVKEKVQQASRIVLFIHGIIGDTESMVPSVQTAKIRLNNQEIPLFSHQAYDLVLAFDYENLNTSISENARSLKQRLKAVGLGTGHGKTLHIVAHSMGGLVSRWFIEREGGKDMVNHLIMLGTPNNGSPWPNVVDFALPLVTVGLNGLAATAWPVSAIGALMHLAGAATAGAERQMTTSLKEMQSESAFLGALYSSDPPGIPYTVIAGNTSLIQPENTEAQRQITALLQKVGKFVVEAPFMGVANDIAVTVNSITHLPKRELEPAITQVTCDHLVYFTHPAGLDALANAVKQALDLSSPPSKPDTKVETEPALVTASEIEKASSPASPSSTPHSSPPSAVNGGNNKMLTLIGGLAVVIAIAGLAFWQFSRQSNAPEPSSIQPGEHSELMNG